MIAEPTGGTVARPPDHRRRTTDVAEVVVGAARSDANRSDVEAGCRTPGPTSWVVRAPGRAADCEVRPVRPGSDRRTGTVRSGTGEPGTLPADPGFGSARRPAHRRRRARTGRVQPAARGGGGAVLRRTGPAGTAGLAFVGEGVPPAGPKVSDVGVEAEPAVVRDPGAPLGNASAVRRIEGVGSAPGPGGPGDITVLPIDGVGVGPPGAAVGEPCDEVGEPGADVGLSSGPAVALGGAAGAMDETGAPGAGLGAPGAEVEMPGAEVEMPGAGVGAPSEAEGVLAGAAGTRIDGFGVFGGPAGVPGAVAGAPARSGGAAALEGAVLRRATPAGEPGGAAGVRGVEAAVAGPDRGTTVAAAPSPARVPGGAPPADDARPGKPGVAAGGPGRGVTSFRAAPTIEPLKVTSGIRRTATG